MESPDQKPHLRESIVPTALRQNRITIDLQHYKQPWIDYCSAHDTTPSEAFRMVVAKLAGAGPKESPAGEVGDEGKVRREIRLTRAELLAAEALADQEGFALPRWIVALIRGRLTNTAQLGQRELELLARSNMQLLALGRNLNQIAKALQSKGNSAGACTPELIASTHAAIQAHASLVSKVLNANIQRWRIK